MKKIIVNHGKNISSGVFRGMLTLAKGAVLARIVGIISIPILTRIYSPEDYGVFALYTALVAILAPALTLRYVQAIPLPKTDVMAINLLAVCLVLLLFGTLVITMAFALFGYTILGWFDMQVLAAWWPLIIVGVSGTALYELFSLWATRKKQYKVMAITQINQSVLGSATQILMGLIGLKPAGLLVGHFIAQTGGVGSFIRLSFQEFKSLRLKIDRRKSIFVSKYYRDFPYYRLPSQFLMVASIQAPVLMMAALYNKELTGQLSLAMMALSLPTSLIGAAVSKAYYAEIAELGKNNISKIKAITYEVQRKLFFVGLPLAVLVVILAEATFVTVFGEEWREAGRFAARLAPFVLFQFTSAPLMEVVNIVGKQINFLIMHLVRFVGLLCLFFFFKWLSVSAVDFIAFLSVYLTLFYFLASVFVFSILNRR